MPGNFDRVGVPDLHDWLAEELSARTALGRARAFAQFYPGDEAAACAQAAAVLREHAILADAAAFATVGEALDAFGDPAASAARVRERQADTVDYYRLAKFTSDVKKLLQRLPVACWNIAPELHASLDAMAQLLEPHRHAHGFTIAPHSDAAVAEAAAAFAAADDHVRGLRDARYRELRNAGLDGARTDRNVLLRAHASIVQRDDIREKIRIIEETAAFLIWDIRGDDALLAAEMRRSEALAAYDAVNILALERLGKQLAKFLPAFDDLVQWVAARDHAYVFAALLHRHGPPFCVPSISDAGEISVSGGRYLALEKERGAQYTPIELHAHEAILITGSHMGGKTSALYAVGTVAALMQLGIPVPAPSARMRLYEKIVMLPPPENAYRGWSSFGAEMRGVADVCAADAGAARLILCDEFARSTNAAEGRALAVAFFRYLRRHGDDVVAVTHLDGIADAVPAVRYQAGGDSSDTLDTMDYRLRRIDAHAALRSRALATARAAGVPAEITDAAAALLGAPGPGK